MAPDENIRVCITMPVFNEAHGLKLFLEELFASFYEFDLYINIVDDHSVDDTTELLGEMVKFHGSKLTFSVNEKNIGHGPGTLLGISKVLASNNFDYLITLDGDGGFTTENIVSAFKLAIARQCEILEGVRVSRLSPIFRKISTKICQLLVQRASGVKTYDANTPLRIYRREVIAKIMQDIPKQLLIPNVFISAYARLVGFDILEYNIPVIESRSLDKNGTTWKQQYRFLPSKRFIRFCYRAFIQWFGECTILLSKLKN